MGFTPYRINMERLAKTLDIPVDELKEAVDLCKTGGFARIWKYEDNGKSGRAQLSVSKKHIDGSYTVGKVVNGYETTFSGTATIAGDALNKLRNVAIPSGGLPIRIGSCDVTTRCVDGKWFTNYIIFGLEVVEQTNEERGSGRRGSSFHSNSQNDKKETKESNLPF